MARKASSPVLQVPHTVETKEEFARIIMSRFTRYEQIEWTLVIDGRVPTRTVWNTVDLPNLQTDGDQYQKKVEDIFDKLPRNLLLRIAIQTKDKEFRHNNLMNVYPRISQVNATDLAIETAHTAANIVKASKDLTEAKQYEAKAAAQMAAGIDNLAAARERVERMLRERDETHARQLDILYKRISAADQLNMELGTQVQQLRVQIAQKEATANAVTLASHAAMSLSRGFQFRGKIEEMLQNGEFDEKTKRAIRRFIAIEEHLEMMPPETKSEIEGALQLFEMPNMRTEDLMEFMKLGKEIMSLDPEMKDLVMEMIATGSMVDMVKQYLGQILVMRKAQQQQIESGQKPEEQQPS